MSTLFVIVLFAILSSLSIYFLIRAIPSSIMRVAKLLEEFGIDQESSLYYPLGNDQAKATNKTLFQIPNRLVYEGPKRWLLFLFLFPIGIL